MTQSRSRHRLRLSLITGMTAITLAGCDQPLDFDLRGFTGGFSTAPAAQNPTANRPEPDARGIITYPTYQVAVAQPGDTIESIATRLQVSAPELARFNAIDPQTPLRSGEVIVLPEPIENTAPSPVGDIPASAGAVDITSLAGSAIDQASGADVQTAALPPAPTAAPLPAPSGEPIQHKVRRGETAYTIARLYNVEVRSLAEWNGLGSDFAIREGQYLLIPVARQAPPAPVTSLPGQGSPTPTPPSATEPLPETATITPAQEPTVDVGATTSATPDARMVYPVTGAVIREYVKGKNDGIDIKAEPGTPVLAADSGEVAAITKSARGIPIIVLRHEEDLLTIYANLTDLSVDRGDRVSRGQPIAKLRDGAESYVHFEVRRGSESADPLSYLQ